MGYDLNWWFPRVGDSGDDKYNVPGATKLDDSVDTGEQTRFAVGDSGCYSSTPTPEELGSGSDVNQVIAAIRMRMGTYNAAFGTSMTLPNYWNEDTKYSNTDWTTLANAINTLRAAEGFAAYTFPTVLSTNYVLGKHLAHLRKALRISGTMTLTSTHLYDNGTTYRWGLFYARKDNLDDTPNAEAFQVLRGYTLDGAYRDNQSGFHWRYRTLISWKIAPWYRGADSITMRFPFTNIGNSVYPRLYVSDTSDLTASLGTGFNGDAYNTDHEEGDFSGSIPGNCDASINPADAVGRAGNYLSTITAVPSDVADSGYTAIEGAWWFNYLQTVSSWRLFIEFGT